MDIGFLGAFLGGLLSLLSPCSVMLLPAFFAYAFSNPATLISRTGVFYIGLLTTLVPLGLFAGSVGLFLGQNQALFMTVAAILVIAFGLVQLLGVPLPGLTRTDNTERDPASVVAVYVLGAAYGIAGVCTGPILGSVLLVAAVGASPLYGAVLLAIYAAGMAFPLLLLSLVWKRWSAKLLTFLRPREVRLGKWTNTWHAIVAGALSVLLGVILLLVAQDPNSGGLLPVAVQYRIESGVQTFSSSIPNLVVLAAIGAVALASFWIARRRKPHPRARVQASANIATNSVSGPDSASGPHSAAGDA